MRIHQHQAVTILRQDVDALELRDRMTQRHLLGLGSRWRLRRHRCRVDGRRNRRQRDPGTDRARLTSHRRHRGVGAIAETGLRHRRRLRGDEAHLVNRRLGAQFAQQPVHGAEEEVVDVRGIAEAHLGLLRVDVDVHPRWIQFQVHHEGRVMRRVHHVGKRSTQRMTHQLVAHCAAVHIQELEVSLAARESRQRDPAP